MSAGATLTTRCCIAGGGPAGMMLGFLLARAGVDVVVLEKHADFFRDFRGDTIHPSTTDLMDELGLLDAFLQQPHRRIPEAVGTFGDISLTLADFTHLPTRCKFMMLMPQWDFLSFLRAHAARFGSFHLLMETTAEALLAEGERIAGVRAQGPQGAFEIRADLVVAADGRSSSLRTQAGLDVEDLGAPMDVLWLRIPRQADDPNAVLGRIGAGRVLVLLDRGEYWQAAYLIPKGAFDSVRAAGLPALRDALGTLAPWARARLEGLRDWDDVKVLTVTVNRLRRWWRDGFLCIGDAAHAMSPIGGVGINLAVQDAVAAANLLAWPLRSGRAAPALLAAVQRRRELPARLTQSAQIFIQNRFVNRIFRSTTPIAPPPAARALGRWPLLRRIPAYLLGVGVRREHIRSPELPAAATPLPSPRSRGTV